MRNLQEDNLHVLEVFSEYGLLALKSMQGKPFQKMLFLIRDWPFPYDYPYGFRGGEQFLKEKLRIKNNMDTKLQDIRRKIFDSFSELDCFLMPHPGPNVATKQNFLGAPKDYDLEFLEHIKTFVSGLLDPEKLVVKEIGGNKVTCRELIEYFKVYFNIFSAETMPEPKTMFEATAEANNLNAVALARNTYVQSMEQFCGGNRPYINPAKLEEQHVRQRQQCLEQFDHILKMGGAQFAEPYRKKLNDEIEVSFEHFVKANKSKHIFG